MFGATIKGLDKAAFARHLRELSKGLGRNQESRAEALGMCKRAFQRYCNEKDPAMPSLDSMCYITQVLNCTYNDLLY